MLTALQRERLAVALVRPRNPLNIGAVARAMANFGVSHLAVVEPYEPHWREAQSAIGAESLLQNASKTATLADAVASCTLVAGTGTLTYRKPEQRVLSLAELAPIVQRELERGGRVAMVFGPEKHGLTREDLSHCHLLVEIPTAPAQPSMNLGQAAAVCLYEVAARGQVEAAARGEAAAPALPSEGLRPPHAPLRKQNCEAQNRKKQNHEDIIHPEAPPAASKLLDRLEEAIHTAMHMAGYSPGDTQGAGRRGLRLLLHRLVLSERDVRYLLGFFRRILWKLSRAQASSQDGGKAK